MSRPKSGTSITERMVEFFKANPDEWLTMDDMVAKFGCTADTIAGVLVRVRRRVPVKCTAVYYSTAAEKAAGAPADESAVSE